MARPTKAELKRRQKLEAKHRQVSYSSLSLSSRKNKDVNRVIDSSITSDASPSPALALRPKTPPAADLLRGQGGEYCTPIVADCQVTLSARGVSTSCTHAGALSAEIEVGGGFFAVTASEGVADCHVTSSTRGMSTPCAHTDALSAVIEGGGGSFAGTASEGVADCHASTRSVSTPCAHAGALSTEIKGGGGFFAGTVSKGGVGSL